jgi:hypothetical protein
MPAVASRPPAHTSKVKVIGAMETSEVIEKMKAAGDPRVATARRLLHNAGRDATFSSLKWSGRSDRPAFQEKEHQYGFFAVDPASPVDVLERTFARARTW